MFYSISPFPGGGRPAQAPETSPPALAPGSCHCSILSGNFYGEVGGGGRGGVRGGCAETRLVGGRSRQKALQKDEGQSHGQKGQLYFLPSSDPEVRAAAGRGQVVAEAEGCAGPTQTQDPARMTWG